MSLSVPVLNDIMFSELKELKENMRSISNLQRENMQNLLNLINNNYNKNNELIEKQNSKIEIIHNLFSSVHNKFSDNSVGAKNRLNNFQSEKTNYDMIQNIVTIYKYGARTIEHDPLSTI